MRRVLWTLILISTVLAMAVLPAMAHPLGNFSINHYTAIEARSGDLSIQYIIDMAEVPTFQELGALSPPEMERSLTSRVTEWVRGLSLSTDGSAVPLHLSAARVACLPGAGGLPILRVEADLKAGRPAAASVDPGRPMRFTYRDTNFPGRAGWKEIVVTGPEVAESSVPATDRGSNRLRSYPANLLTNAPGVVDARFTVRPNGALPVQPESPAGGPLMTFNLTRCSRSGSAAAASAGGPASPQPQSESTAFGALFRRLAEGQMTSGVMAIALLGAFALGVYHSMTPGHGKTILAAYFIGSRGSPWQAVLLGAVTTLTHTSGVFILGFATLIASRYVVAERLYPWLSVLSGVMLLLTGASLFRRRLRRLHQPRHAHDDHHYAGTDGHEHAHGRHEEHHHGHTHVPGGDIRARDLITLGITGGLLPCPSALIVMLAAISVGQIGLGLLFITAFSIGLAAVLTAGGMLMVYARSFMTGVIEGGGEDRTPRRWRVWVRPALQRLPIFSAAAVALLGLAIILQTVSTMGLMR